MNRPANHFYEFGPFRVDPVKRLLLRDGETVPLEPRAFSMLLFLVQHYGKVVEKDDLLKRLWPGVAVEENNLTVIISALRKVLGERPSDHKYIVTIPGRGYSFVADVNESWDEKAALSAPASLCPRDGEGGDEPPARTWSIAVLPFKRFGEESGNDYLGMGLADALITRLGTLKRLVVRPTSAIAKYANLIKDLAAVGREMETDLLLDGRLQSAGDRIRVTAQLISVRDGALLWSEQFDEKATDLFAVEDSISEQIATALMLKLSGDERYQLTKRHTENDEAYRLYLRGRFFWNKRTDAGLKKSVACFNQAITADPNYALAYAGLADSYVLLGYYYVTAPGEAFPQARAAAARALEIDSLLAEAHTSLAYANLNYYWNWTEAERGFKRAIDLKSNYATARHWYSDYLSALGRFDEAVAEIKRAQELDPLSLIINGNAGYVYYLAREYDLAVEQLRRTIELDPNFVPARWYLGEVYWQMARRREAIAELRKAVSLSGRNPLMVATLGQVYALSGMRDKALAILNRLISLSKRRYVSPYRIAMIHLGLGDKDRAFEWLKKACEDRSWEMAFLKVAPTLDSLRSDPSYTALLRSVGGQSMNFAEELEEFRTTKSLE